MRHRDRDRWAYALWLALNEDRPADRKLAMTDDTIISTPGRPDIHVLPRDNGGVMLSQRKNRIWMSAAEVAELVDILTHIEAAPW